MRVMMLDILDKSETGGRHADVLGQTADKNLLDELRELSKKGSETTEDAVDVQKINGRNPKTRLPRSNGKWSEGVPGNGAWKSDKPTVNKVTEGEPIQFVDGRPNFTPWVRGQITFNPGVLDGSKADFDAVYDYIAQQKGLKSRNAAKNYLREAGLTPHHLNDTTIQLIPTDLHGNIPHIGAASDLRGGVSE